MKYKGYSREHLKQLLTVARVDLSEAHAYYKDAQAKALELQKAIEREATRAFPTLLDLPARVEKKSSTHRYMLFNILIKNRANRGSVYRDRLKTGGLSVKAEWLTKAERKIARRLCDKVSRGVSTIYDPYEHKDRQKYERYIFLNIPGKSQYAKPSR